MKKNLIFLLVVLTVMIQFACRKNNMGGTPEITNIRSVDTTARDSSFMKGLPGNLIVIQGNNLGGLQAVYFNDTSAYFNPVYATNSNIIVNIPSYAQTAATDPNVSNLIKVVTNHGTATYDFKLYLTPPGIRSISFNDAGTKVLIAGFNFEGIKKITFPGGDTALAYSVDTSYQLITATIPQGSGLTDSLRVYCTYGTASFPFPPPMTITSVSDENAPAGTTIILTGTNFVGIDKVIFPGNIPGTNLQPVSVTELKVTVPPGITTPDQLTLMGVLGTTKSPYLFDTYLTYPSPGYLCTFENPYAGDVTGSTLAWTGTIVDAATTATNYPGGTGACHAIIQNSPMPAHSNAVVLGNPGAVQLDSHPWVADPATVLVKDYSLQFEIFVKKPWSAGILYIGLGGWYGWNDYAARYAPWDTTASGTYQTTGWVTVTIPLTQMLPGNKWQNTSYTSTGDPATHISDLPTTQIGFLLTNFGDKDIPANTLDIAVDNVRIVKTQ